MSGGGFAGGGGDGSDGTVGGGNAGGSVGGGAVGGGGDGARTADGEVVVGVFEIRKPVRVGSPPNQPELAVDTVVTSISDAAALAVASSANTIPTDTIELPGAADVVTPVAVGNWFTSTV